MSKLFWNVLKIAPVVVGASLFLTNNVLAAQTSTESSEGKAEAVTEVATEEQLLAQAVEAQSEDQLIEQIDQYSAEDSSQSLSQVTDVSQLRDVQPTDWAYEALRSLVERYGCIEGYPDQTYRGNRALTRYEFAAGLNSCLNAIEALIAASGGVTAEDLATLQRLLQEFEAELATLGARVDNLEGRVAFLEENQFSTTAKLSGEVIFAAAQAFGVDGNDEAFDFNIVTDEDSGDIVANLSPSSPLGGFDEDGPNFDSITTLSDRVRLNFDASFTGEDTLRVRLEAGNSPEFDDVTNSDATRLGFEETGGNNVEVTELFYQTPVGERFTALIGLGDTGLDDFFSTVVNPYFASSGTGALSRFGRRNPVVYRVGVDQGLSVNFAFNEALSLDVVYGTSGSNIPEEGEGLFNGDLAAGAQLNFEPNERLSTALTYVYSYQPFGDVSVAGSTSSAFANAPFGNTATRAHRLGAQASYQLGERINLAGWFGYAFASPVAEDSLEDAFEEIDYDNADILTAAVNVAFLDLLKEGSVLGLIAGIPPYNTSIDDADIPFSSINNEDFDEIEDFDSVPLFFEAQYQFPLNDNIQITPGAYVIVNPNQNADNAPIIVGVIRGTFKF